MIAGELIYGENPSIQTAAGERQLLPSRSFMAIGEGQGRTIDF